MSSNKKTLKVNHLTEIGRVVTTWAVVDYSLMALASDLTSGTHVDSRDEIDDNASVIPYAGMGTRTLVGLILSLIQVRHKDEELIAEWLKLSKKINQAKGQRDIIAHCIWAPGTTSEHIKPTGFKSVGGLKGLKDEELHVNALTDRATYNILLSQKVWDWRYRLNYLDPPSQEELIEN